MLWNGRMEMKKFNELTNWELIGRVIIAALIPGALLFIWIILSYSLTLFRMFYS